MIEERKLLAHVAEVGGVLREGLESLKRDFGKLVGDVRGKGLMQAIELVEDEAGGNRTPNAAATLELFEATKKRGVLIGKGGLYGNVVRIAPPMIVSRAQVEEGVRLLGESLREIS